MATQANPFGRWKWVDLDYAGEPSIKSYNAQVAAGLRRDTEISRLKFLFGANYAFNYIHWLRRRSNDPAFIARAETHGDLTGSSM